MEKDNISDKSVITDSVDSNGTSEENAQGGAEISNDGGILSDISEKQSTKQADKMKRKKTVRLVVLPILGVLIFVLVLNMLILPLTGKYARVAAVDTYDGDNQYITLGSDRGTMLSAHRAGGDLAPEETLAAFKLCMESSHVDIVEFDLHLTADGHLVLMHDHEVDRTSDGAEVFSKKKVKVRDKTLAELKTLNFGYNFCDAQGNYPYRNIAEVPDDVRILTLNEVLSYLKSKRPYDLTYIIEIKDKGDVGKEAMDKLYELMCSFGIVDRTIVGTFNEDISNYIDSKYADKVKRSAGIREVLDFYFAFLWGVKQDKNNLKFDVLQIPMGFDGFFDLSTRAFIDYAHSLGVAVQYWTINDESDMRLLIENGADAIMTDNPELANRVKKEMADEVYYS